MDNEIMSYDSAKSIIRRDLESMSRKFITIGYYLKLIRDNEMYRQDGFRDIWEFAQDTYGISKSTCSRWMAMNDKFSQGGNSPYLKEEYRDFGKSQLQEMLYLTDEQMEQARPDMTAKEIREIRKPEEPKRELKKPDETEKQYLKSAAKRLIICWHVWFLQDYMNRVMQVDRSPKEIKKKIEGKSRCYYFQTDKGTGHINLFDDSVQIWNEIGECLGDFDWFYLASAIQTMWSETIIEDSQKKQDPHEKEKIRPYDRGCITGKSPSGNCVCCGKGGVECCAQCKEECNGRCGWIDVAPAQQESEEQIQEQMEIQDYPEILPEEYIVSDSREQQESVAPSQQEEDQKDYMNPPEDLDTEETAEEIEVIAPADPEEKYEELSDKTDMELLRDLLHESQNLLKYMNELYTENDIRVRKQKLIIGAYAGMIADLDQDDIPEDTQPELPYFKNNDQRKEWLRNYQAWGLWYEDKNIGARYYKYDFDNGARLIAEEYTRPATEWYEEHTISYLHLVGGPEPPKDKSGRVPKWNRHEVYDKFPSNETELVEFLKYVQKEQKYG